MGEPEPPLYPDPESLPEVSSETAEQEPKPTFKYVFTDSVAEILGRLSATLWVTTYQAGKLAIFRANGNRLSLLLRTFDKAMGLALSPRRMAIGTRYQIWHLLNEPSLAPKIPPRGSWDTCYLPRSSHVTGNIDIHELSWGGPEGRDLWFVNTLYSALCTLSPEYSFVPRWQPPFISGLRKQDRCHLNGMAMGMDGVPAYVTAFGEIDTPNGWREGNHKRESGVVIDVASSQTICRGLSMPHSPRLHQGRLWVLDSGNGRLLTIDPKDGSRETVADLPGYPRGLAFFDRLGFVGLSRVRNTAVFSNIAIAEKPEERKCGIWIIDTVTGQTVGWIEFQETVDEVFDVQFLPGTARPHVIGLSRDGIEKHCVISPLQPIEA